MITVACVLEVGLDRTPYVPYHVARLRDQVKKNLTLPHRFVCLSNLDTSGICEWQLITGERPGFWAKLDLFKPGRFTGRVLYLDLDSTVIGSLDDLVNYPVPFAIIKNFKELKEPNKARFNSSVMVWDAGVADHIYNNFTPEVMDRLNGDQDWISEQIPYADTFPKDWCVSYKVRRYAKLNTMPKDARVVCYHGQPKPFDLPDDDLQRFTFV